MAQFQEREQDSLRINRAIRADQVRVIAGDGQQLGVMDLPKAQSLADEEGVDLVEIVPKASPPVCKIIDYGKYRYNQTKKEREGKKAQSQVKLKEVKVKPRIEEHDFSFKLKRAREFLEKGHKVKITCMFRGRELAHPEFGERVVKRMCEELQDVGQAVTELKRMGRMMTVMVVPSAKKKSGESS